MASPALTKPHITLTGKAVWQCADAHLSRSGRSWKQAYDRWLLASLRDAASVANLCQPAATAPKKRGRPRKEVMPMGWYVDEQAKQAEPESAQLAELHEIASSVPGAQLRQPGSAKPKKAGKAIVIASTPKASAIEQPSYHASMVIQAPAPTRREYSPPAGLLRNMERAAAVQPSMLSISVGEKIETTKRIYL